MVTDVHTSLSAGQRLRASTACRVDSLLGVVWTSDAYCCFTQHRLAGIHCLPVACTGLGVVQLFSFETLSADCILQADSNVPLAVQRVVFRFYGLGCRLL
jgi:hypothetical protein